MTPVLMMKNVSAYDGAGRALLTAAELTVLPGERVRVIAERARFDCLARIAGGLMEPDDGEAVRTGPVGYMAPEPDFWEDMTVLDNAALPLMAAGVPRRERRRTAMDALECLGLGYAAHTYPKSLGPGEQRLAALARALVKSPALLILADPLSMLDEKQTRRFASALAERWDAARFAVLYCAAGGDALFRADKTVEF